MSLTKVKFEDARMELLQQNVEAAISQSETDLSKGRTVSGVVLTTSGKTVDHKLGRIPKGFFVTMKNANADVWVTAKDEKTISLDASSTVTIDFWVY